MSISKVLICSLKQEIVWQLFFFSFLLKTNSQTNQYLSFLSFSLLFRRVTKIGSSTLDNMFLHQANMFVWLMSTVVSISGDAMTIHDEYVKIEADVEYIPSSSSLILGIVIQRQLIGLVLFTLHAERTLPGSYLLLFSSAMYYSICRQLAENKTTGCIWATDQHGKSR
jgi:hypothetical protein